MSATYEGLLTCRQPAGGHQVNAVRTSPAGSRRPLQSGAVRIAALDLGSNSFHLLVADAHADGSFEPLVREKEMLRLGDLVASSGRINAEAADRAVDAVKRFKALAAAAEAD